MTFSQAVDVAVDQPVDGTFTYNVPDDMTGRASAGMRVLVPFGGRKITGYILGPAGEFVKGSLKDIEACLDDEAVFSERMLGFYRWISSYYLAPIGKVIKTALPAGINSSSLRTASITEAGKKIPEELREGEKDILTFLAEKGEVAVNAVGRRFGRSGVSSLHRLANRGLVRTRMKVKRGRVKVRTGRYVTLLSECGEIPEKAGKRASEIAEYIRCNGDVLLSELVRGMRTTRKTVKRLEELGVLRVIEREVYRDPYYLPVEEVSPPVLTPHQEEVMEKIGDALQKGGYSPFLLEGKTGSGKTEIYLRAIESTGGKAIVLVPEISLTPQLSSRFRERFGDRVAVLHSGLSPGERYDQWRRIKDGAFDIVIGARSAIFAPLEDVRIIIVDEEHEPSYKQEEGIRYNARDLALVRGRMEGSLVILGSATPSLESVRNVREGRFAHLCLPERINRVPLPSIEVVDMRKEEKKGWISARLKRLMEENLKNGEQTLLFLNRRGFAPSVICRDCGHTFRCPNCSVTLTWHQGEGILRCHYCDYRISALPLCPGCGGGDVIGLGMGTERLEEELMDIFAGARIVRMDRDAVRKRGSVEGIVRSFEKGEADILIGTQMVAKGHHFPGVTLAGVLLADLSLNIPDFRAAERTFQLLTQVAGRAGRGDAPGRVVIQTYSPEHYSILHGGEEDSRTFYEKEMSIRKEMSYPPFSRLLNFRIDGRDEESVIRCARSLKEAGRRVLKKSGGCEIEMIGPAPSPISRLKKSYRWQMLAKCTESAPIHRFAKKILLEMKNSGKISRGIRVVPDFDPYSLV